MLRIDGWSVLWVIAGGIPAICGFWMMRLAIRSRAAPQWKRRFWLATSVGLEGSSLISVAEAAITLHIFPAQQPLIRWLFFLGLGEFLVGYIAVMFFMIPSLFHYYLDPIGDVLHDFRARIRQQKRRYHHPD